MSQQSLREEFEWYNQEIAKKRKELDEKRQAFFALDAEVSRMERERSRMFPMMFNEYAKMAAQTIG